MMRTIQMAIACVVMLVATAGQAEGAIHSAIVLSLRGNPHYYFSESGGSELHAYGSTTEHADNNTILATTVGAAYVQNGDLGIGIWGSTNGVGGIFDPVAGGEGKANWFDHISLQGNGDLQANPPTSLQFHFDVSGTILVTSANPAGYQSEASATANVSSNGHLDQFYGIVQGGGGLNLFPSFYSTIPLISMEADYYYGLDVLTQTSGGTASADFLNTMKLASITFADGTTPESHGYELVFASGIKSPNLAVPEPNSLALWVGIAMTGLALGRRFNQSVECSKQAELDHLRRWPSSRAVQ